MKTKANERLIRKLLLVFMIVLFLSGLTAIPIDQELSLILPLVPDKTQLHAWLHRVLEGYRVTKASHPFLIYGYDWLAFAHFILALLFIGPYRNPVKNIWVIEFGLMACILILPLAFIAGYFRGIPIGWQLIDCSFGIIGFLPLWVCYIKTKKLETVKIQTSK